MRVVPLALGASLAWSADIATVPPTLLSAGGARPNLMFILDDSRSMTWDFTPDSASAYKFEELVGSMDDNQPLVRTATSLCAGAVSRNRSAYNPANTYLPPLAADGSSFPNATFTAAWINGFNASTGTFDLSTLPALGNATSDAIRRLIPPQTWVSGTVIKQYAFFYYATPNSASQTCDRAAGGYAPTLFSIARTAANIAAPSAANGSAAALTNYANWFAYYRTRTLTMRTGAGRAFASIDATRFRVGFMTINDRIQSAETATFLHINNFESQKTKFFSKLYSAPSPGGTPLRLALSMAGAYFAKKAPAQTYDPVQYACQRNYSLLTTDGYWNEDGGQKLTASGSLTAMGNEDGPSSSFGPPARPFLDDSRSSGPSTGGSGVGDTLADAAYFYYKTDLRSPALGNCSGALGTDVCSNTVAPVPGDDATHQHMNTYTLGLGVAGELSFDPDYTTQTSGSYVDIRNGVRAWPRPLFSNSTDSAEANVDDLWHAAVNGRGYFYSATDPQELATSLSTALTSISVEAGSGAGAGTSSLRPVAGDNNVYVAKYTPAEWSGELESYQLDPSSGAVLNPNAPAWKASVLLKNRNLATNPRSLYVFNAGASSKLSDFSYASLSAGQKAYFDNLCTAPAKLSQCATLAAVPLAKLTGSNLVAYLGGSVQYEGSAAAADNRVFRTRVSPLGDLVNASPVYVKRPPFRYVDGGYAGYSNAKANRTPMVYAAANDGMLHAFNATTGQEMWAYLPSMVLPEMYRLADVAYGASANHRYFVDATPSIADVYDSSLSQWRTILVGGLGAGGKGYYALDITDPANPKGLWEFTNTHLGLTFGNAVVSKLKNGAWAAILGSGYDNNSGGGDGNGRVFVLNALTGVQISAPVVTYTTGTTPAGTIALPSNLGRLNAWVDDSANNTAKRVYAGDMLGNFWRFDIDDLLGPVGNEAQLMGVARSSAVGPAQPITSQPQLSEVQTNGGKLALVSFGTGRLLGQTDLSNSDVQSVYVVKDDLSTTNAGVFRSNTAIVQQIMGSSNTISPALPIDWSLKRGWFVDFSLNSKERVVIDPDQRGNSLTVVSSIPSATACSPGGFSRLYSFNVASAITTRSILYDELLVGLTNVWLRDASGRSSKAASLLTRADGSILTATETNSAVATTPAPRRSAWRELIN